MTRKIALLDMDAFFAAAELRRNPALAERPFAIGGRPEQRGVIATANYIARRYGVKSAISSARALQLCPQLILLAGDHEYYRQLSRQIREILEGYCPLIEQASIDEFYLDLSDNSLFHGSASLTMEAIRADIRSLDLTASAGISCIKMVAKIASDDHKPDGQKIVEPHKLLAYIASLPLERIPGVGPASLAKLQAMGYFTGHDIQRSTQANLIQIMGAKQGMRLFERCRGIDSREVEPVRVRKSKGVEKTLNQDIYDLSLAEQILTEELYPELLRRLGAIDLAHYLIHGQTVKLKFSDFQQTTVSHVCRRISPVLFIQLLRDAWLRSEGRGVRLVGLSVSFPSEGEPQQLELEL